MNKVLISLAFLIVLASCQSSQSTWKRIQSYGCTDEKIEIKDKIGQCKCQDGSQCMWTENKPIMGCPCNTPVKNPSGLKCAKQAAKYGCGATKFECSTNFGNCTCPDNSQCVWAGEKEIMGCPCGSGAGFNGARVKTPGASTKQPTPKTRQRQGHVEDL